MEVVASLSQGRTAAAQCGLFTYKSVPVIFEPPCTIQVVGLSEFLWSDFFLIRLFPNRHKGLSQSSNRSFNLCRLLSVYYFSMTANEKRRIIE